MTFKTRPRILHPSTSRRMCVQKGLVHVRQAHDLQLISSHRVDTCPNC